MGSLSNHVCEIPKVDLTGILPSLAGGEQWEAARMAVAAALHSHGCFVAICPTLSTELTEAMLDTAAPDLFSLPLETKLRVTMDEMFHGYIGQIPHLAYESLPIDDVDSRTAIEEFTHLMWPEGNSTFFNTVTAFVKPLHELVEVVQKMVLQSLGVEKHHDSLANSTMHSLRLSEYGVPVNEDTKIALDSHLDPNLLSVVCQHKIGGLEVQAMDSGDWIIVPPSPNSVAVIVGQSFQAWTNMRARAPRHRVRILEKGRRFSAIYSTRPIRNSIVKSPEELGDDESGHPLLYKPFNYTEFVNYQYSEKAAGKSPEEAFNSFCMLEN